MLRQQPNERLYMGNKFLDNGFIKLLMKKPVLISLAVFLSVGLLGIILVLRSFLQLPDNL
jgi:hypothetical protein